MEISVDASGFRGQAEVLNSGFWIPVLGLSLED